MMTKKTLSFISLAFFIFTTTHSLLTSGSNVIYDTAGNKLLQGIPYFITPLLRGTGGGLTLSRATKDTCPLDVVQEPFELGYGVPFTFTPIIFDENYIRESYPVSIEADITDPCHGSKILKVTVSEDVVSNSNAKTVTIGGESNTPESCFQFVEDDMMPGMRSYQVQVCPFKCGSNNQTAAGDYTCYNVGVISNPDGKRFFAPTDVLFPVVFENSFGKSVQSE